MKKICILFLSFVMTLFIAGCQQPYEPILEEGERLYAGYVAYSEIENGLLSIIVTKDGSAVREIAFQQPKARFSNKPGYHVSNPNERIGNCGVMILGYSKDVFCDSFLIDNKGHVDIDFDLSILNLEIDGDTAKGTFDYVYIFSSAGDDRTAVPFGPIQVELIRCDRLPKV